MKINFLIILIFLFAILLFTSCSMQQSKNSKDEEQFLTNIPQATTSPSLVPSDLPNNTITSVPQVTSSPSPVPSDLPNDSVEPTNNTGDGDKEYTSEYEKYIGKWFASQTAINYDSTWSDGGYILEIKEIKDNYIKGYYASIQAPPANRIADFNFEGCIKDNKLTFNFEDGFFNTGKTTIEFKDLSIEVKISDLEISEDNPSGWCVSDAIFSIESTDK